MVREVLIKIRNLSIEYKVRRGVVKAVRDVDLDVYEGEILFLVGESGSGKSTLGLSLMNLVPPPGEIVKGEILFKMKNGDSTNILNLKGERLRRFRWKEIAMVFQSSLNALNPVMRIWDQMYDAIEAHNPSINKEEAMEKVSQLLSLVLLDPKRTLKSYPHELSGGMKQRVIIAMSLLLDPKLLILDEPTTALDILTQKNIIDLLKNLRKELGLTMIFITHDLSLAAELADRVAVMYAGRIVEVGSVKDIFYNAKHPYTFALIRTVPKLSSLDEELYPIPGTPPDMINLPPGCKFHPRCEYATGECRKSEPELEKVDSDHMVACHRWRELEVKSNA